MHGGGRSVLAIDVLTIATPSIIRLGNPQLLVFMGKVNTPIVFFRLQFDLFRQTSQLINTYLQGACLMDAIEKLVEALARLQPVVPEEGGQEPPPRAADEADEQHAEQRAHCSDPRNSANDISPSSMSESKPSVGKEDMEKDGGESREKDNANIVEPSCDAKRNGGPKRRTQAQEIVGAGEAGRGEYEAKKKVTDSRRGSRHDQPLPAIAASAATVATPHVDFWDKLR